MHLSCYYKKWLALTFGLAAVSALPAKPNVVLIYADDMGYGEVEALNPERCKVPTPSLNQLAEEGMVFTDAHTTSSVCTPSRYSLLTGRYNWRSRLQGGVLSGGRGSLIAPDRKTLGHLFQEQGYRTAIFGKWHLDYRYEVPENLQGFQQEKGSRLAPVPVGTRIPDGPISRGFDTFYGFHHARSMGSMVKDDTIVKEISVVEVLPAITQATVDFIDTYAEEAKQGRPFFIYFPQSSPHTPIAPAPEWVGKTTLGAYGDFVAQTDGSVGAVMQALERNGLTEDTIVIFSADNGTSKAANFSHLEKLGHFASANLRGSKADLWDGGHRVPFILRWPKAVSAGSSSDQLVSLGDLFSTFAAFFDYEYPDNVAEDSISFLPALYGQKISDPRVDIVHHSISGHFSIRSGPWKLLLASGSAGWTKPNNKEATQAGLPSMQLYNLDEDLGEQNNLVDENPAKVAELIALLESHVARGRSTPGKQQSNDAKIDIWKRGK